MFIYGEMLKQKVMEFADDFGAKFDKYSQLISTSLNNKDQGHSLTYITDVFHILRVFYHVCPNDGPSLTIDLFTQV